MKFSYEEWKKKAEENESRGRGFEGVVVDVRWEEQESEYSQTGKRTVLIIDREDEETGDVYSAYYTYSESPRSKFAALMRRLEELGFWDKHDRIEDLVGYRGRWSRETIEYPDGFSFMVILPTELEAPEEEKPKAKGKKGKAKKTTRTKAKETSEIDDDALLEVFEKEGVDEMPLRDLAQAMDVSVKDLRAWIKENSELFEVKGTKVVLS